MSQYIVSARKYRPQHFDEVVGQEHVSRTLKNALRTNHLAHAFLFTGPRGVGKTTCARILAKTINCENPSSDYEACGECISCVSFADNAAFNIIELDAASNNSVEHIRTLNEQVRIPPQRGKYKVFIIDEVHMLSQSAFNAFLKTLEEPPPYAIFILATTEKHKIIPTILSRCQIYDFKRIQVFDIADQLARIADKENIIAEREALITIARKADGALRDALSLFDRLASLAGEKLTYETVVRNLSILDYEVFFRVVDACSVEDLSKAFLIFDEVLKDGFETQSFLSGLATHYRDLLVSKDESTFNLLDHDETVIKRYKDQASRLSKAQLINALHLLNQCEIQFARSQNKRLHLEMLLVKLCYAGRLIRGTMTGEQAPASEKKTEVQSLESIKVSDQLKKPQPVQQEEKEEKEKQDSSEEENYLENSDEKRTEEEPAVKEQPSQVRNFKPRQDKMASGLKMIPQLNSLDHLQNRVKEAEAKAKAESLELNLENLRDIWDEYALQVESPSVTLSLKEARLELEGMRIKVFVGTQLSKSRILEEVPLLDLIRKRFHNPRLGLTLEVDPSMAPEDSSITPKKILTNKEKYERLCAKNPLLQDLKKKLDLIVDHDEK